MQQNNKNNRKNTGRDSSHGSVKHSHSSSERASERAEQTKYGKGGFSQKLSGKAGQRHQSAEKDGVQTDVTVRRSFNYNGYKKKGFGRFLSEFPLSAV